MIALHTELFLGPACKQTKLCPIFSFQHHRDDEVARLANEREEKGMHQSQGSG